MRTICAYNAHYEYHHVASVNVCTNTAVVGSRFTGDSVLVDFFCVKVFDQLYSADRVTRFSRFHKGMSRASD